MNTATVLEVSQDLVDAYVEYSGDRNGLHVSHSYARHYLNGRRVCHGTLLVSLALSNLPELYAGARIHGLKVDFEIPVCIGDTIATKVIYGIRNIHIAVQNQHGARCLKLDLMLDQSAKSHEKTFGNSDDTSGMRLVHPMKRTFADCALDVGVPKLLDYADAELRIPEIAALRSVQPGLIRLLARLSYSVGMISPGAQSLFSGFSLTRSRSMTLGFTFELSSARENLSLFSYRGCYLDFEFTYSAFLRVDHEIYALNRSVAMSSVAFGAVRAVVIGGSSGLGARVAEEVVQSGGAALVSGRELENETGARLSLSRLDVSDVTSVTAFAARVDEFAPTHLFYMASPRIFERGNPGFSLSRFEKFLDVYVMGLIRLLSASKRLAQIPVFWPSTMLLDPRSGGNAEYLISKAIGERMLEMLAYQTGMKVFRPRLGEVNTGQTSSLVGKTRVGELPRLKSMIEEFLRS